MAKLQRISTLAWTGNWVVVIQSHCRVTLGNNKVTNVDCADEVAIFFECLETLVEALDAFTSEAKLWVWRPYAP